MSRKKLRVVCEDCKRPYGHEHGFPDLVIPFWAWKKISSTGDDGGLLCPSCICMRLHRAKIRCTGAFMSGPIISVSEPLMEALRGIENIELAIDGRDNRWSNVRKLTSTRSAPATGRFRTRFASDGDSDAYDPHQRGLFPARNPTDP